MKTLKILLLCLLALTACPLGAYSQLARMKDSTVYLNRMEPARGTNRTIDANGNFNPDSLGMGLVAIPPGIVQSEVARIEDSTAGNRISIDQHGTLVTDHGVLGNGVSNDLAGFKLAHTAAKTSGRLIVPDGQYILQVGDSTDANWITTSTHKYALFAFAGDSVTWQLSPKATIHIRTSWIPQGPYAMQQSGTLGTCRAFFSSGATQWNIYGGRFVFETTGGESILIGDDTVNNFQFFEGSITKSIWQNVSIDSFPQVSQSLSGIYDPGGSGNENYTDLLLDHVFVNNYGGGSNDNAFYVRGRTIFRDCIIRSQRTYQSHGVYSGLAAGVSVYNTLFQNIGMSAVAAGKKAIVIFATGDGQDYHDRIINGNRFIDCSIPIEATVKRNTNIIITDNIIKIDTSNSDARGVAIIVQGHGGKNLDISHNQAYNWRGVFASVTTEINASIDHNKIYGGKAIAEIEAEVGSGTDYTGDYNNSNISVSNNQAVLSQPYTSGVAIKVAKGNRIKVTENQIDATGQPKTYTGINVGAQLDTLTTSVDISGNQVLLPDTSVGIFLAGQRPADGNVPLRNLTMGHNDISFVNGYGYPLNISDATAGVRYGRIHDNLFLGGEGNNVLYLVGDSLSFYNNTVSVTYMVGIGHIELYNNTFLNEPGWLGANNWVGGRGNKYGTKYDRYDIGNVSDTVNADAGRYRTVSATLTDTVYVKPPTNPSIGLPLTYILTQNGSGNQVTNFDAVFKVNWTPDLTASKKNSITFNYDGTNWVQTSTATGL